MYIYIYIYRSLSLSIYIYTHTHTYHPQLRTSSSHALLPKGETPARHCCYPCTDNAIYIYMYICLCMCVYSGPVFILAVMDLPVLTHPFLRAEVEVETLKLRKSSYEFAPVAWRFPRARHWTCIPYLGLAAGEHIYIYIYIYTCLCMCVYSGPVFILAVVDLPVLTHPLLRAEVEVETLKLRKSSYEFAPMAWRFPRARHWTCIPYLGLAAGEHMYIYIYIYTYICMYVCVYVCMYACMYVCMYVIN